MERHFRPHVLQPSHKQIARELHVSRNTVRKILRSGATEFEYERSVQPQPRLGPWREELDRLLAENAARASRERLTLTRVFEELRGLGYQGGYDAVRRYASGWRRRQSEATAAAFVPLSFAPGEAYQFDWSHEVVLMRGMPVTVKVAHVRLCHSRMLFVRAYPRETHGAPENSLPNLFGERGKRTVIGNQCTIIPPTVSGSLSVRRRGQAHVRHPRTNNRMTYVDERTVSHRTRDRPNATDVSP